MANLTIINRSDWPTPAIDVIVRWVCRREKVGTAKWPYNVTLRSTTRNTWRGRGGKFGQTVTLHRRFRPDAGWPYTRKDHRFVHGREQTYRSRLELLVYLLAHEAHHATAGHPDEYRKGYRTDRESMEYDCNLAGERAVESFRVEWPVLFRKIMAAMRSDRKRRRERSATLKMRRADPAPKIAAAEEALAKWRRKLKLAQTKIKKYQRRLKYYQGRMAAR